MRAANLLLVLLLAVTSLSQARQIEAQQNLTIQRGSGSGQLVLLVDKTGLLAGKQHRFLFTGYSGVVTYFRARPTLSSVQFTAVVNSLQVTDTWIKEQDRMKVYDYTLSDKMLDARRYPHIEFVSQRITKVGESSRFRVEGTLSIHGKQKPITVMVEITELPDASLLLEGTSKFRLSDFDLKRPSAALGTVGTKDEVLVTFRMSAKPTAR